VGFLEDVTKRASPRRRLAVTALAGLLGVVMMDAVITRADIPVIDWIVATSLGAVLVTLFVVAGVSHSINIIDGMNGLASMCTVIMLAGLSYVALQLGDHLIAGVALAVIGAVLGFFLWNYPRGLVFLGDGGAYFLGFMLAELGVLMLVRHPEVSPLFPLLLCGYPVFETLFSMYRRRVVRGRPVSMPDGIHLHSLVYRRLMRWALGSKDARTLVKRNSATSPYLWVLCTLTVVPATLFWDDSSALAWPLFAFMLAYVYMYRRIVRFSTPRVLVRRGHNPAAVEPAQQGR
jgi:UDP-N-acetylmuramyl pentapeptide phosphotransferase/UDP-N-acetylglucosamine-1-phosphate transferase